MAKERKGICGVYKITNTLTNKVYIGYSTYMQTRLRDHKRMGTVPLEKLSIKEQEKLQKYKGLYLDVRKYGEENFTFDIITTCETRQEAFELESKYILEYNSHITGYNTVVMINGAKHDFNDQLSDEQRNYYETAILPYLKHSPQ